MSLRAFHILFIVASTSLVAGFGAWCFSAANSGGSYQMLGAFSIALAAGLLAYGVWFYQKIKNFNVQ